MFFTLLIILASFAFVTPSFYKGFHFEYHNRHHLILMTNATKCYVVTANSKTVSAWNTDKHQVMDELIIQISSGKDLEPSDGSLLHRYHDYIAVVECLRHDVVVVHYTFGQLETTDQRENS